MSQTTARLIVDMDAGSVVTQSRAGATALQGLIDKTAGLTRQTRSAKEAAETFFPEMAAVRREVMQLRTAYDPVFAAQQRLEAGQATLTRALQMGQIELGDQRQLLDLLEAEYNQVTAAQARMQGGTAQASLAMRLLGVNSQQVSQGMRMLPFQLNQMAQMGAVTGNWMQAVSIQLPDILQGFGAARLVFLGTAAGLATALVPALIQSLGWFEKNEEAARDWSERLEDLQANIDAYADAVEAANRSQRELYQEFGSAAQVARVFLDVLEEIERVQSLEALDREVSELIGRFGALEVAQGATNREASNASRAHGRVVAEMAEAYGITRAEVRGLMDEISGLGDIDGPAEAAEATHVLLTALEELFGPFAEMNDAQRELFMRVRETGEAAALLAGQMEEAGASASGAANEGQRLVTAMDVLSTADASNIIEQADMIAARLGMSADAAERFAQAWASVAHIGPGASGNIDRLDANDPRGAANPNNPRGSIPIFDGPTFLGRRNQEPERSAGGGGGSRTSPHDRAVEDIQRRIRELAGTYEMDLEAAEDWRTQTLAGLDRTSEGYETFAGHVQTIYEDMLADAYDADLERREDWAAGIQRGLAQVADDTRSWADAFEDITVGTLERGEDAWVEWVTTGKGSLSDLVDFAIEQFARMAYQQAIQPALSGLFDMVSGGLGGIFGGGAGIGGIRSHSGSVVGSGASRHTIGAMRPNEELALVERGQSIFTPRQLENADMILRLLASQAASSREARAPRHDGPLVVINNQSSAQIEQSQRADGATEINIFDQIERDMAGRMRQSGSPLNRALRAMGVKPVFGNGNS